MDLIYLFSTETHELFRQTATTMNFFPVIEKSRNIATPGDLKSMNLFPQQAGFGSSHSKEVPHKMADSRYVWLFIFVLKLFTSTLTRYNFNSALYIANEKI